MTKKEFSRQFPQQARYYDKLDQLARMVEQKGDDFNITAIRKYKNIWLKHIVDSLMLCRLVDLRKAKNVMDIGTGAGFPGLPLAITYPEIQFTLVDSKRKKIDVVSEFASRLELRNVQAIWVRVEDLAKDLAHKSSYNIVTARAVAYLPNLLQLAYPFIRMDGNIIAYKSGDKEEINAGLKKAGELNLQLADKITYRLQNTGKRVILVFRSCRGRRVSS